MPSLRRLNRRLTRWRRYFGRYRHVPFGPIETLKMGTPDAPIGWGRFSDFRSYWRLRGDVEVERERRGLDGEPCDDDDFHRPGYEEDGSIYPALMVTEIADVLDDGGWNWKRTADGGWYSGPDPS